MKIHAIIVLLAAGLAVAAGGCGSMLATGPMAEKIELKANQAKVQLDELDGMTADQLKASVAANAQTLGEYYQTATVNWFAYRFGDKQIYVSMTLWMRLREEAIQSENHAAYAAQTEQPTDNQVEILRQLAGMELTWLSRWKLPLHGKHVDE